MILDRVTITGVDDTVSMAHLSMLSAEYLFVEWGVLFSADRQGAARYPSFEWLRLFARFEESVPLKWSAHLCGRWARDAMVGIESWWKVCEPIAWRFLRVQLNVSGMVYPGPELNEGLLRMHHKASMLLVRPHRFIIQCKGVGPSELAKDLASMAPPHLGVLFDASGGRGKVPDEWPHAWGAYCGYAGGLNPDNVEQQLRYMALRTGDQQRIWIDMESGVRNADDRLDLGKMRAVLEQMKPYIGQELAPRGLGE